MIVRPSNSGSKNVTGSAKSLPQPGRSAIGMFFEGVWIVGYAPLIWRTLKVIPIFFAYCWIVATMPGSTPRVAETSNTFLHALASQMPLEPVEYFDRFIAAFALAASPWSPACLCVERSGLGLVRGVGRARVDDEPDFVDVLLPRRVCLLVVVRVPHAVDQPQRAEAAGGLPCAARRARDVVDAVDHVARGRDQVAGVL